MITKNLRFPDLETWETLAKELDLYINYPIPSENEGEEPVLVDDWQWIFQSNTHAIDNIGTIWNDDAVWNEETGELITPPTPMAGYHVNYKCNELPASLTSYEVTPQNPYRKFAGDP